MLEMQQAVLALRCMICLHGLVGSQLGFGREELLRDLIAEGQTSLRGLADSNRARLLSALPAAAAPAIAVPASTAPAPLPGALQAQQ